MATVESILAVDTATEKVSVALITGDKSEEVFQGEYERHSESVLPMIDSLLTKERLAKESIDVIAFGAGPGAFTGLRVACGVAQGLAWALGKPLVAVSNLEATAVHFKGEGTLLVALDARMKECYCGVYTMKEGKVQATLLDATLVKPEKIKDLIHEFSVTDVSGSAFTVYKDEMTIPSTAQVHQTFAASALSIAKIALLKARKGDTILPQLATPLYVRNRVALTIDERKKGEAL